MNKEKDSIDSTLVKLRDPRTIRSQSTRLFELAQQHELEHFAVNLTALPHAVSFVTQVITQRYPKLNIPYHSRWRHLEVGSIDRVSALIQALGSHSPGELGPYCLSLSSSASY
jgi:hypothetical protein